MSSLSLQTRLLAAVGLIAVVAVAGVAVVARQGARRELYEYAELVRRDAHEEGVRVLRALAARHAGELSAELLRRAAGRLPPGATALLVDERGALVAAAGAQLPFPEVATRRENGRLVLTARGPDRGSVARLYLPKGGVAVHLPDGRPATLELIIVPNARQRRHAAAVLDSLDRRLIGTTAAAGGLALLLTWLLARRMLAPVRHLQAATRDLAGGRLDRRVAVVGSDELADLGSAFNAMADELQRQQRLRRDLTGDVAHELRAPLTAMLCRLEAVQDGLAEVDAGTLAGFHQQVLHLTHLVDDLQELALADAGQLRLQLVPSSLAAAASSAVRAAGLENDPRLRLEIDEAARVLADPVRLRQVLTNLLSNGARHTPAGGTLEVLARRVGTTIEIEIRDSGCGLDAEQLSLVFERFYRTDPSRQRDTGGSGLGLAIVKALVEAQGGRVWARSAPGEGARFGFALPATP